MSDIRLSGVFWKINTGPPSNSPATEPYLQVTMFDPQSLNAEEIAAIYPHNGPGQYMISLGQIKHRVQLIKFWEIGEGENILEIGCGQGDCTISLAAAIGESGHVTAVDPAPLDYGNPFTLGQAQAHLKASPLGSRISFVQADPVKFIADTTSKFTTAVLAHCIWYFASPDTLREILRELAPRVDRICLAEYALTASDPRCVPHLLAALTQASLECHKEVTKSNIRTILSPVAIHAHAKGVGLVQERETTFLPNDGMYDGRWEVGSVMEEKFLESIHQEVKNEREKAAVIAMRDSVKASKAALAALPEPKKVFTMDVWASVYKLKTT